jgi:archaellum component FlaC
MSLTSEDIAQVRSVVIGAIETLVLPRFEDQDRRFDQQDERFDAVEGKLARMEADIKAVQIDMRQVKSSLGWLEGHVEALEADIKELYVMVAAQKPAYTDKKIAKLSVEQKVLRMYEDVKLLAQEAGVTLPNEPLQGK